MRTEANAGHSGDERLSEVEVEVLRRRFAERRSEAVTVQTIAEAAGLDLEVVREHLRQIRAERAFAPPRGPKVRRDWSGWLLGGTAVVALGIAGMVTFQRIEAVEGPARRAWNPTASGNISPSTITTRVVHQPGTSLPLYATVPPSEAPPPGFELSVAGLGREFMGSGNSTNVSPLPYLVQRDRIVWSLEQIILRAQRESPAKMPQGPYRDRFGNLFDLGENEIHFGIKGWPGSVEGKVKLPLDPAGRSQIRRAVEKVFAETRRTHEAALGKAMGPIVGPPPGYRITFGGRRLDDQIGPRVSFAPVDRVLVRNRLEAALRNAAERDARPPVGEWTQNAARESKIPAPKRFAGSIEGPGGTIPFDIPASPPSALRSAIRDLADRASRQIDPVNAKTEEAAKALSDGTTSH